MAHEWYIQHGGKQHGPVSSAQLKKLAAGGKINPATKVRLGSAGNWVVAGRVQGLFAAQPVAQQPAVEAPPVAPPPAPPPMASPLARVPLGSVASASKAGAAETPLAPRIVGAVALILGILALATFWLPMLKTPLGFTGIVVGALGLLLAIGGLVLSAVSKGSGLYLNVAAASSSVVGLVLTVVLGITFGLFAGAPPKQEVAVARPVLPPPAPPPVVEVAPEPEPEPEPPPEPIWTDAGEAIELGPIRATVESVGVESVRLESADLTTIGRAKPQPMLRIRVKIENTSTNKIVEVPGWSGMGGGLAGNLSGLLGDSELGKAAGAASAAGKLTDDAGNNYAQTPALRLPAAQATFGESSAVRPGDAAQKELVYDPPLESIEYLRLELAPAGFSGSDPLRFQIPRAMIAGM